MNPSSSMDNKNNEKIEIEIVKDLNLNKSNKIIIHKESKNNEVLREYNISQKNINNNFLIFPKRTFTGHTSLVTSIIYFSSDYLKNYFISSSRDNTIRIWNKNSKKCEKIIKKHSQEEESSSINLIKWNFDDLRKEGVFLSCGSDMNIFCFSISREKESNIEVKVIKKMKLEKEVSKLLKLNNKNNNFIALTPIRGVCELYLIDFNEFEIIKKINLNVNFNIDSEAKLENSLIFKNCFYLGLTSKEILIINYESEKIEIEVKNDLAITYSTIFNPSWKKEEEFLIFCSEYSLNFFKLEAQVKQNNIKSLENEDMKCDFIRKIEIRTSIQCSSIVNNKYLLVGGHLFFSIFDLSFLEENNNNNYGIKFSLSLIGGCVIQKRNYHKLLTLIIPEEEEEKESEIEILSFSGNVWNDSPIDLCSLVNIIKINDKGVLKRLNEKCKNFVNDEEFFNEYINKKVSEEELRDIVLRRIEGEIIKDLPEKYFRVSEELGVRKNEIILDFKSKFFFQKNDSVFSIGEFSFNEKSNKRVIRNGFGCEFIRVDNNNNYKLFYVGEFKENRRGRGKMIISKNRIVDVNFEGGNFDLLSLKEFNDEYIKIREHIFPKDTFSQLFQKKWTKDELMGSQLLVSFNERWILFFNNFFNISHEFRSRVGIQQEALKIVEGEEADSSFYFGLINTENAEKHGFGIEFLGGKGRALRRTSKYFSPVYVGEFKKGKREGKGKIFDTENQKSVLYEGGFKNGLKEGKGIEYCYIKKDEYNLILYEGTFKKGKRNGRGRIYDLKEKKFIYGIWEDEDKPKKLLKTFKCPIIGYRDIKKHLMQDNKIGSGAFGDVYKVRSSAIKFKLKGLDIKDEYLAIKVMKRCNDSFERETVIRMLRRGIELCYDLKNKDNFMETYAIFQNSMEVGCVMECCKDSIDKEIIKRKGNISLEVAKGMANLHRTNTMHRDLKWGNILQSFDNKIKITDFDTLKEDERTWNLNARTLTSRVGTPGYSAPEIHVGKKYGLPVDVFSFGIMIYSLLFELNQPYLSQFQCQKCNVEVTNMIDFNTLHEHVSKCNFRPLLDPEKIMKYPRYLIDLMIFCWDKDPSRRPTFEEIYHILEIEAKKKKIKSYFLVEFSFPKHKEYFKNNKLLLLNKDEKEYYVKIMKYLTTGKYEGCKIKNLDCKQGGIYNNDDILDYLKKEESPILEVEFSEFIRPEIEDKPNKKIKKENVELKIKVERLENEKKLFKMFLQEEGISFEKFSKFCKFQKEETEGEDDGDEEEEEETKL